MTPRPLEHHWDVEAVNSVIPRDMDLPDGPTPVLPGQPPDLLTAIVSGRAGTWHPGQPSAACGGGPNGGGSTVRSGQ